MEEQWKEKIWLCSCNEYVCILVFDVRLPSSYSHHTYDVSFASKIYSVEMNTLCNYVLDRLNKKKKKKKKNEKKTKKKHTFDIFLFYLLHMP